MALTRAQVEVILIKRCGILMEQAGLDGVTQDGTNVDLNDPIAEALRTLDIVPTDPTHVVDLDLAGVATTDYGKLFDAAEIRVLETVHTAVVALVDITVGPRSERLGQMAAALERLLDKKRVRFEQNYGVLEPGVIGLEFAEHSAEEE